MVGAKYPAAPLGLITIAAMLPRNWTIRLIDHNAEEVKDSDLEWACVIMTGGMMVQQWDTLAIIERAHCLSKPVVVGGPGITSSPEAYTSADFKVLGEAEGILDQFVSAWNAGARSGTFVAEKFQADISQSPVPRFDLINFKHYLHVGIQFSRGCPFVCEFCDIIELYGRVPRTKTSSQVLEELDRLYTLGYRGHIDFVDDNLVGNKKALQTFLPHLKAWQVSHNYPFEFSTEASINLSDDTKLLQDMRDANFFAIFIGLESADGETLIQTRKKQNTRRDIVENVQRFYDAGIFVIAGFIIGFDGERSGVAASMLRLIEDSNISVAMVGLLYALPNTQLAKRLASEGRMFESAKSVDDGEAWGDQCTAGLNFSTHRPRRDILDDYRTVLNQVYLPEAFFARARGTGHALKFKRRSRVAPVHELRRFLRLMVGISIGRPDMRLQTWALFFHTLRHNPRALPAMMRLVALYVHLGPFSQYVIGQIDKQVDAIDTSQPGRRDNWRLPLPALPAVAV
jgi:radical SAM superfamily enzyme YgiQ (UPF0313 family)